MQIHWIKSLAIGILLAGVLGGCATQANRDPLEGLNRGIYKFNDVADKAVIKPIAGAYKAALPSPVRSGVNNFFSNLATFVTVINDLLQFKLDKAMDDTGRLAINTTFGIGGLVDWASMDGIEERHEDLGQTLGYWGVGDGAFLMLPLLGPSTIRDTAGLVVDSAFIDPLGYIDNVSLRNQLLLTKFVDTRAQYLPGSDLLDEAALDPYVFLRDAYLQRRHSLIQDGNVSNEKTQDGADAEDDLKVLAAAPEATK